MPKLSSSQNAPIEPRWSRSQSVVFPNQVSGRSRLEVWGSRCNVDYLWGFVDYLWVFDDYLWGFWCLFHGVLMIICGHFDKYLRFFWWLFVGKLVQCWYFVQILMIICGHFHDYGWWESYDYLCRVWGLYVGLLMIIFGEAGEMLIIFCGVCGHFDDN